MLPNSCHAYSALLGVIFVYGGNMLGLRKQTSPDIYYKHICDKSYELDIKYDSPSYLYWKFTMLPDVEKNTMGII